MPQTEHSIISIPLYWGMGEVNSTSRGKESDKIWGHVGDLHHFTWSCITPNATAGSSGGCHVIGTSLLAIVQLMGSRKITWCMHEQQCCRTAACIIVEAGGGGGREQAPNNSAHMRTLNLGTEIAWASPELVIRRQESLSNSQVGQIWIWTARMVSSGNSRKNNLSTKETHAET